MEDLKRKAINEIIDSSIKSFADGFELKHIKEAIQNIKVLYFE